MKKIIILSLLLLGLNAHAKNVDYENVYRTLEVPTHSYVHNVDPGEFYDTQSSTWSPYPLFRIASPIFFKTIAIEPGYYALTPQRAQWQLVLYSKKPGKIKYIILLTNAKLYL